MGAVTVTPDTFTMVHYEHAAIVAVLERAVGVAGLGDVDVTLDVDERIPLARVAVESLDPVHLRLEGGALEDPRHPRQLDAAGGGALLARHLLQIADRRDPAFGAPALDAPSTLAHRCAWDVYAVGRAVRRGEVDRPARWRYAFRTRHGFTDVADAAFDRLWDADGLTWADLVAISDAAAAAAHPAEAPAGAEVAG